MDEQLASHTAVAGQWVTLVPVEVFGGDCDCHHAREMDEGKTDCHGWCYGLSDAVQAWSDCNRAIGHIFRVEDTSGAGRKPGETIRVWVANGDLPALTEREWGEDPQGDRSAAPDG